MQRPNGKEERRVLALVVVVLLSFSFFASTVHAQSVVATIKVGSGPFGVAYDSGKGEVYVANSVSNTVSVISDATNTVVASVAVGSGPPTGGYGLLDIAYDSAKGEIFAGNWNNNTVSVISDALSATSSPSTTATTNSGSRSTTTAATTTSGGFSIPEFPFQPVLAILVTVLMVSAFLIVRRKTLGARGVRPSG
jgi:YVTN family beta-propeller protein